MSPDADPALQPPACPDEYGPEQRLANRIRRGFRTAAGHLDTATAPLISAWGRKPEV
ncbi:hypothetical protein [Streptomyces sp. BP-8]|uniref:Uncharacterized protein n=1 Tax=Streptomyces sirii TaxID=3127701 RepID=A0ABZ2QQQ9_9ACTN